eukprot:2518238-Rhodomonas_salina.1
MSIPPHSGGASHTHAQLFKHMQKRAPSSIWAGVCKSKSPDPKVLNRAKYAANCSTQDIEEASQGQKGGPCAADVVYGGTMAAVSTWCKEHRQCYTMKLRLLLSWCAPFLLGWVWEVWLAPASHDRSATVASCGCMALYASAVGLPEVPQFFLSLIHI